jgi:hypothetical protein
MRRSMETRHGELGDAGLGTELFLNAQQLVVLGKTLRAARGTSLDLAGVEANDEVRNERVLRTMSALHRIGRETTLGGPQFRHCDETP